MESVTTAKDKAVNAKKQYVCFKQNPRIALFNCFIGHNGFATINCL